MTKKAFENIAGGLQEAIVLIKMAKEIAKFDDFDWDFMKADDKNKYIRRSKIVLQAAYKAYDLINKVEIE